MRDSDKPAIVPLARELVKLGFSIYSTVGTSTVLRNEGIPSKAVFRIADGRPNVIDMVEEKEISWIINTPSVGVSPKMDEIKMRSHAVIRGIPITTTIDGLRAAIDALNSLKRIGYMEVCSLQEYHRHAPKIKIPRNRGKNGK